MTKRGEISEAEIDAAARALFQVEWAPALAKGMMPCNFDETMKYWRQSARAALEAAAWVRAHGEAKNDD